MMSRRLPVTAFLRGGTRTPLEMSDGETLVAPTQSAWPAPMASMMHQQAFVIGGWEGRAPLRLSLPVMLPSLLGGAATNRAGTELTPDTHGGSSLVVIKLARIRYAGFYGNFSLREG